MRTLLNIVACGALSIAMVVPCAAGASSAGGRAASLPWVIDNGQPVAGLYVPRDIRQAYAKGTRSPTAGPARTTGRTRPSTASASA